MADTATYDKIATTTLGSAASSITFSSIAASWTDLRLVIVPTSTAANDIQMQFNGDTATNYSYTSLRGNGTSAASSAQTTVANISWTLGGQIDSIPHFYTGDVFSYSGSTYKTILMSSQEDDNGSGIVGRTVGLWRNTAAITSIRLFTGVNFLTGTTATLYGIKSA